MVPTTPVGTEIVAPTPPFDQLYVPEQPVAVRLVGTSLHTDKFPPLMTGVLGVALIVTSKFAEFELEQVAEIHFAV